jgi:hypothetical protein
MLFGFLIEAVRPPIKYEVTSRLVGVLRPHGDSVCYDGGGGITVRMTDVPELLYVQRCSHNVERQPDQDGERGASKCRCPDRHSRIM